MYFGGEPLDTDSDKVISGSGNFGWDRALGDFDGDGLADILVGGAGSASFDARQC